jgi:quercetin dioxygenase-like cupin family protein
MAALERDSQALEDPVRKSLTVAACLIASTSFAGPPSAVVLENARVRVWKVTTAPAVFGHPDAVFVAIEDDARRKAGDAYWSRVPEGAGPNVVGTFVIVELKDAPPAPTTTPSAADPAAANPVFTGMSFVPLFENDRVKVIRGRMDVGAREGLHTHASDIVLVHLTGGTIEDVAAGQTKVLRWKHGDVEFEGRGSSHSARNLGPAVDAVLVTLKP